MRRERRDEVTPLARSRGLLPVPDGGPDGDAPDPVPSTVPSTVRVGGRSACSAVFATPGEPRVVVGNREYVVPLGSDPGRIGFVAVRHDVVLPHVLVSGGWTGAASAFSLARSAIDLVNASETGQPGNDSSGADAFRRAGSRLDGLTPATYVEKGAEDAARRLLTPDAFARIAALADSFEIEVRAGWVAAHRLGRYLATDDPQTWDWALSCASRLVDLASVWRATWPPVPGAPAPAPAWEDLREAPWYTPDWVERPPQADGPLSPRALRAGTLGRLRRRGEKEDER